MDILLHKGLEWINDNDIIIKETTEDDCIKKIKLDKGILAEYRKDSHICRIIKYKKNSQYDIYNKYADTIKTSNYINNIQIYALNNNKMEECQLEQYRKECDEDDDCLFINFNKKENKCEKIKMENNNNSTIYIKN